jgi:hypothetical protein
MSANFQLLDLLLEQLFFLEEDLASLGQGLNDRLPILNFQLQKRDLGILELDRLVVVLDLLLPPGLPIEARCA